MYNNSDVFGLTGGMGSGKSTVSQEFARLGATIVDADQIVRELQQPGHEVLTHMATILGADILDNRGALDRREAGKRMFADEATRRAVMEMMDPYIWGTIDEAITTANPDAPKILDAPLLLETKPATLELTGIIVVETSVDIAVQRLMQYRGYSETEARQRIATQMSIEERRQHADFIIKNNDTPAELSSNIQEAWQWMHTRRSLGKTATERSIESREI